MFVTDSLLAAVGFYHSLDSLNSGFTCLDWSCDS